MNVRLCLSWLSIALVLTLGSSSRVDMQVAADAVAANNQLEGTILFEITPYIYTVSANGENLHQLAFSGVEIASPKWSPDGQRIAFTANQGGNWDIYVINPDGNDQINLTESPATDRSPHWSPDGKKILFIRREDSNPQQAFMMDVDGTNQVSFTEQGGWNYEWSPTGRWIAYSIDREETEEIFLASADGTETVQLTDNRFHDILPEWSPDGERIAFVSSRDGNNEIYTVGSDGSGLARLTHTPEINEYRPIWSPDGRYIAYQVLGRNFNPLYVMYSDGTNQVQIGEEGLLDGVDFTWSPDSRHLAVSGWHSWEGSYIYVVDVACVDSSSGCGLDNMVNIVKHYPEITTASPPISLS